MESGAGTYEEAFRRGLTGEPPAQQVGLGSVQVRSMAAYALPDADYRLPSKNAIKDKKLKLAELVELVGGQTSVRTTFDPDSVQVILRDLMDAQERRREGVLELVRKNRAKMQGVERKGVLPDIAVGDYVYVARIRQPGITPKLISTWTGPWRVVSKIGGHVYVVDCGEIVTGRSREVHFARCGRMPMHRQRHRGAEGGFQ